MASSIGLDSLLKVEDASQLNTLDPLHAMQFRPAPLPLVRGRRSAQRPSWSDRDCPLDTVRARSLWHADGTTGENDNARTWRRRLQLGGRVRPVPGYHRVVGKHPKGVRQKRVG